MKPEPDDKTIQRMYREILKEGIDPAQIRAEKKAFISLYFPKKPFFVFRPAVWTPAMAFAVAAFAVFVVRPELFITEQPAKVESSAPSAVSSPAASVPAQPSRQAAASGQSAVQQPRKNIVISHVSSEAGATVVYQKTVENVPVAVVWVVPNPGTA